MAFRLVYKMIGIIRVKDFSSSKTMSQFIRRNHLKDTSIMDSISDTPIVLIDNKYYPITYLSSQVQLAKNNPLFKKYVDRFK